MLDYLVSVVTVNDDGDDHTHQTTIMAGEQADAWAQGMEIATDSAAFQGGAIKAVSVTEIK